MWRIATAVAAMLAFAAPAAAQVSGGPPPPSVAPPPVVVNPHVVPQPLANRPERTAPPRQTQTNPHSAPRQPQGAQPQPQRRAQTPSPPPPPRQPLADAPLPQPSPQSAGLPAIEPNIVLVSIPADAAAELANLIAGDNGLSLEEETEIALLDRRLLRLRITDGRSVGEVVDSLGGDGRIDAAQPSLVYVAQAEAGLQYAAEKLRLAEAHELSRGEGVVVAVIDTGVDGTHEALATGRVKMLSVFGDHQTPGDHGTQMAGIIASADKLTGVSPAVELVSVEAFAPPSREGAQALSNSHAVVRALDMAASEGAQVINMSFAGGEDPLVSQGLDILAARGTVLVAAAGNNGPQAGPAHPGAHPRVIAVTATDADDGLFGAANRGGYVAVAAPGVDVIAPAAHGRYLVGSGTSLAAAHVSGAAALILQRYPGIGPEGVMALLAETAHDLGPPGPDPEYGAGLFDPVAALSHLPEQIAAPAEQ